MTLTFRQARLGDIPDMFELRGRTRENPISPEELAVLGITPESTMALIASGRICSWVCLHGASLVGFASGNNRNGARPDLADLTDCFTEKATIVRHSSTGAELYTVGEFATPRIELLTQGTLLDFHEWEVTSATQIFDGIAARISRYCRSGLLNGHEYSGSGTKCFHLVDMGFGWRISSLAWVDDA